jgi:hypothetical protein
MSDRSTTLQVPATASFNVEHLKALDLLKQHGTAVADTPEKARVLADLVMAGFAREEGNVFVYTGSRGEYRHDQESVKSGASQNLAKAEAEPAPFVPSALRHQEADNDRVVFNSGQKPLPSAEAHITSQLSFTSSSPVEHEKTLARLKQHGSGEAVNLEGENIPTTNGVVTNAGRAYIYIGIGALAVVVVELLARGNLVGLFIRAGCCAILFGVFEAFCWRSWSRQRMTSIAAYFVGVVAFLGIGEPLLFALKLFETRPASRQVDLTLPNNVQLDLKSKTPPDPVKLTEDRPNSVTLTDGRSQIMVPRQWRTATELHNAATIQACDIPNEAYVVVTSVLKTDLANGATLHDYAKMWMDGPWQGLEDVRVVKGPVALTIHGRPAVQYEIHATVERMRGILLRTFVDGPTSFHQLIAWTLPSKIEEQRAVLDSIIQSFQETGGKTAAIPQR